MKRHSNDVFEIGTVWSQIPGQHKKTNKNYKRNFQKYLKYQESQI
jgi:hypothetical protein